MKLPRRQFLHLAAATASLPVFASLASAQTYPTRPARIIVPLTAGSAADIFARVLPQKMSESWGQPVVVENQPGAGTTLATGMVVKAPPDGHTLLVSSAAFATSAAVYPKLPYDPLKDFAPVSQIATAPIVVVAAPSLGAKSIKELVELATGRPGQVNFGSSGVGSRRRDKGEHARRIHSVCSCEDRSRSPGGCVSWHSELTRTPYQPLAPVRRGTAVRAAYLRAVRKVPGPFRI
jgi:tripartite-type tricarboxylate transporter receptor subunit TctC